MEHHACNGEQVGRLIELVCMLRAVVSVRCLRGTSMQCPDHIPQASDALALAATSVADERAIYEQGNTALMESVLALGDAVPKTAHMAALAELEAVHAESLGTAVAREVFEAARVRHAAELETVLLLQQTKGASELEQLKRAHFTELRDRCDEMRRQWDIEVRQLRDTIASMERRDEEAKALQAAGVTLEKFEGLGRKVKELQYYKNTSVEREAHRAALERADELDREKWALICRLKDSEAARRGLAQGSAQAKGALKAAEVGGCFLGENCCAVLTV